MNAIHLSDEQLLGMSPRQIEAAFHPLPGQGSLLAVTEAAARYLGFVGTCPWHAAECESVYDTVARGSLSIVRLCGGSVRLRRVRTGFLESHFEVNGHKFNHWGGGGAFAYAAALAAVRGLRKLQAKEQRRAWRASVVARVRSVLAIAWRFPLGALDAEKPSSVKNGHLVKHAVGS